MWRTILIGLAKFTGFFVILILAINIYYGVFTASTAEKIADTKLIRFCESYQLDCNIFIKIGPNWRFDRFSWVIDYANEEETIKVIVYVSGFGSTDVHSMFEEDYKKPLTEE